MNAPLYWRQLRSATEQMSDVQEPVRRSIAGLTIRAASGTDGEALARIYNHYIANTTITFEEIPVGPSDMAQRVEHASEATLPFLVAEADQRVVGYAYSSPWRPRSAYRFSVEITVYVDHTHAGRGTGSMLYASLFPLLQQRGIHSVIGGIALPNDASVALHEKFGLRQVARFEQVGFKLGRWVDVGYWQRVFE
jgi:phosphinothricin acetyltransferase